MATDKSPRMYTERTIILVKPQSVRDTESTPDPMDDAFFVGEVELSYDPEMLERVGNSPSFSPEANEIGRIPTTISFTHEIKGSGDRTVRSKLGLLLSGCKMRETYISAGAATQINDPVAVGDVFGPEVTWAKSDAPTSHFGSYLVRCVVGGASAAAQLQVFRWNQSTEDTSVMLSSRFDAVTSHSSGTTLTLDMSDETAPEFTVGGAPVAGDQLYAIIGGMVYRYVVTAADVAAGTPVNSVATALAAHINADPLFTAAAVAGVITVGFAVSADAVTVTSGTTEIALGASGAVVTPTWTGTLVAGQEWIVTLSEVGYQYTPTSNFDEETQMTIWAYIDGELHRIPNALGTVTFTGEAGGYGSAEFEFRGAFRKPVPEPLPRTYRYERTKPPKVELSEMSIHGWNDFCAESFSIELGNSMSDGLCMNAERGHLGTEISGREPTATMNPRSGLDVYTNMWGNFADGEEVPIHLRVGLNSGNAVRFYMDYATYTGLSTSDTDGVRVSEPEFQLNRLSDYGDDELRVCFV